MLLTLEDIEEFKRIYKKEFGEDLTDAQANEMAGQLIRLYDALGESLPEELKELGWEDDPDFFNFQFLICRGRQNSLPPRKHGFKIGRGFYAKLPRIRKSRGAAQSSKLQSNELSQL